ncbi:hypothetical protein D9M68_840640 [compost metagenome]
MRHRVDGRDHHLRLEVDAIGGGGEMELAGGQDFDAVGAVLGGVHLVELVEINGVGA